MGLAPDCASVTRNLNWDCLRWSDFSKCENKAKTAGTTGSCRLYSSHHIVDCGSGTADYILCGIFHVPANVGDSVFAVMKQTVGVMDTAVADHLAEAGAADAIHVAARYLTNMILSLPILYLVYVHRNNLQAIGNSSWSLVSGIAEAASRVIMAKLFFDLAGVGHCWWMDYIGTSVLFVEQTEI